MSLNLKLQKSAGVRVTAVVHRLIHQGNTARNKQLWGRAANAYRAALDADPTLHHILIQLAHMLKEDGRADEAKEAYGAAFAMRPMNSEPLVQIAHLCKLQGDPRSAAAYLCQAIRISDDDADALNELQQIMTPLRTISTTTLRRSVKYTAPSPPVGAAINRAAVASAIGGLLDVRNKISKEDEQILRSTQALLNSINEYQSPLPRADGSGIVFDVSDLIAHFRHHRLPTGIQRVQIEVVTRALRDTPLDVRVCTFVDGRDTLLDLPGALFVELAMLSTSGKETDAPEWALIIGRVFVHLLLTDPFVFRLHDRLINLGTSWWIYDYFLLVRNAKRDFAITYIPFIHDFIPIMTPEHCVTGVIEDYVSWLIGAFDHADAFLVNSRSTGQDLIHVARRLARQVDPSTVEIVPLDADFRQPSENDLPTDALGRWDLTGTKYCLFVSTIESRKNHVLAVDAWARLIELHGIDAVPMLVCVGRSGWLNEAFFERLRRNGKLRERVTVIERVSDSELALLYRSCLFTIYPSHYEGWGLPVTESLCYGKVPVVANNSSLTEAGGTFAVFFESNSTDSLVQVLERLLFEAGRREAVEQEIATHFQARSWAAIAAQVTSAVIASNRNAVSPQVPSARLGLYYPVSLYKGTRIWPGLGSGEAYRTGTGWLWPEPKGCRTRLEGGHLLIPTTASGPLRLYLRLFGLKGADSAFSVSANGRFVASGNLEPDEERWVLCDTPPVEDGLLSIFIHGGSVEVIEVTSGGTSKRISASIGIAGFAFVERDDKVGRLRFIEHSALSGLGRLNAYAEPRRSDSEKVDA